MRKIDAVIGAGFGDEGKGRTVDWLVANSSGNPLVIRHNSGAQAGHTVQIGDKRHVFSHFGSGTLRNAPTLLCHKFVVNPILFNKEWDILEAMDVTPLVFVDPTCMISTPLDMILNQVTEVSRGAARHGSCGVGFGDTIDRYQQGYGAALVPGLQLYLQAQLGRRSVNWRDTNYADIITTVIEDQFNWDQWYAEYNKYISRTTQYHMLGKQLSGLELEYDHLIFEGAQGLMLHESHGYFPHVTRSRTGAEDIVEFLQKQGIEDRVDLHYCTRTYMTRHGAGPLPAEIPTQWDDPTNKPNEWQGTLRAAPLFARTIGAEIDADLIRSYQINPNVDMRWNMVLNWADKIDAFPKTFMDDYILRLGRPKLFGCGPDSKDTVEGF